MNERKIMSAVAIEEWENIKGYEGLYQVSNYGQVKQLNKYEVGWCVPEHIIYNFVDDRNEVIITLWKDGHSAHMKVGQLVAQHFVPNPQDKKRIHHKDGNTHHNGFKNLEWV